MKKKTARRWLNRNKWNIAKLNFGFFANTQFKKQYRLCKKEIRNWECSAA